MLAFVAALMIFYSGVSRRHRCCTVDRARCEGAAKDPPAAHGFKVVARLDIIEGNRAVSPSTPDSVYGTAIRSSGASANLF
ncbi:hypothetical protein PAMC26577_32250 [Caballeronia sordidicola]|uniref:Uncharacterized protein n=1 Tax=Caballeronia sordidicola TaxID=196367 RepID=A0A242MBX2_CABSO|nr:hypothetical protein PAMC26577_32250 [Caballeronia sordidicola]